MARLSGSIRSASRSSPPASATCPIGTATATTLNAVASGNVRNGCSQASTEAQRSKEFQRPLPLWRITQPCLEGPRDDTRHGNAPLPAQPDGQDASGRRLWRHGRPCGCRGQVTERKAGEGESSTLRRGVFDGLKQSGISGRSVAGAGHQPPADGARQPSGSWPQFARTLAIAPLPSLLQAKLGRRNRLRRGHPAERVAGGQASRKTAQRQLENLPQTRDRSASRVGAAPPERGSPRDCQHSRDVQPRKKLYTLQKVLRPAKQFTP